MSKRTIIIFVVAALCLAAAVFSLLTEKNQEITDLEKELNPVNDNPDEEKFTGPRKGFYWNRVLKKYVPAKVKTELVNPEINPGDNGTKQPDEVKTV
jgi:hypothetical protein